jgi:hypothetical protein
VLVVLVLASGCGVKTAGERPVRTLEDGRLSIDPAPVTLADLAAQSERAPRAVLRRLWFSIQWWDEPAILAAYVPAVVETVGASRVLRAWKLRRGLVIGSRPRGFETTRRREIAVVTFGRESRTSAPAQESATMLLERGGWRILHDTMLEEALAADAAGGLAASRRLRDLAARVGARRQR